MRRKGLRIVRLEQINDKLTRFIERSLWDTLCAKVLLANDIAEYGFREDISLVYWLVLQYIIAHSVQAKLNVSTFIFYGSEMYFTMFK